MSLSKTIGVDLWAGQARAVAPNHPTLCGSVQVAQPRLSLRDLFLGAYARFAAPCREVDEPGVALLAVDEATGAAAGLVRLRARVGRHVAAIVGRHGQCDLFLEHHSTLALRHLAFVVDPVTTWRRGDASVRYRILDLRTDRGFTDEHGKAMRGLRAEGPAILRCAGYAIFALPLGDPSDWPMRPADAWDMLPERVYFDELQACPDGSRANISCEVRPRVRTSMIARTHGPRETGEALVRRDLAGAAGVLEIIGETRRGEIAIGEQELRDGVLLGRYARCAGAGLLEDVSMSRVHAMLIRIDDSLLVVDTASRNGTFLTGQALARVVPVDGGVVVHLGNHTHIRWRWAC